jgi:perosamine synthetase
MVKYPAEPPLGGIYGEEEIEAVVETMRDSSDWRVGFRAQREVEAFESAFAELVGAPHAVAVNGAGAALDLVLRTLELGAEDEVVSNVLNFPGTHLAVIGAGARLVLAEPEVDGINVDAADLAARVTSRTRAFVVTHMNGQMSDLDAIEAAAKHPSGAPLPIIYDAARSLGATYRGAPAGAAGYATVYSLQSKKLITTLGEGGVVTTAHRELAETLRQYRSFGMGVAWGSNFKLTRAQAKVGLVQLGRLPQLIEARRAMAMHRHQRLKEIEGCVCIGETETRGNVYYLYTLLVPERWTREMRDHAMQLLERNHGIGCIVGNPPTSDLNILVRQHAKDQHLPRARRLAERIVCPSLHPSMSIAENREITDALVGVLRQVGS